MIQFLLDSHPTLVAILLILGFTLFVEVAICCIDMIFGDDK
jgi:hypothetical protein